MKQKALRHFLEGAQVDRALVRVCRVEPLPLVCGFVLGLSEEWALLQQVDRNLVRSNGFCAIRLGEIKTARLDTSFFPRVLLAHGDEPVPQPDILLADLAGLLSSVNTHFPLVTLHFDRRRPPVCYIGRVQKIGKKRVTLEPIDGRARWLAAAKYDLEEINTVEFGDAYSHALWELGQDAWRDRTGYYLPEADRDE